MFRNDCLHIDTQNILSKCAFCLVVSKYVCKSSEKTAFVLYFLVQIQQKAFSIDRLLFLTLKLALI